MGLSCPICPCRRTFDRLTDDIRRAWKRRTNIEHHLDVGTELLLHLHCDLRGETVPRSVVDALKGDSVIIDFWVERKDLKTTGISEREPFPSCKFSQPAEVLNDISTWSQHEVIRVSQHDLRTDISIVVGVEILHRTTSSHRHKRWGLVTASGGDRNACTGLTRGCLYLKSDRKHDRDVTGVGRAALHLRSSTFGNAHESLLRTAAAIGDQRKLRSSPTEWFVVDGSWS